MKTDSGQANKNIPIKNQKMWFYAHGLEKKYYLKNVHTSLTGEIKRKNMKSLKKSWEKMKLELSQYLISKYILQSNRNKNIEMFRDKKGENEEKNNFTELSAKENHTCQTI